jgi:pyochelin synthetase
LTPTVRPRIAPALTAGDPPTDRHAPFPLTDIQHAYWIGRTDALELGGVACHVYVEWQVAGLDLARLEAAWNRLIRRHDMMRAIVEPDGRQRILPEVPPYRIVIEDLRGQPAVEQEAALAATRARMAEQVLDAGRWPMFELRAARLDRGLTQLHLDLDLLMFDVQSFHIILAELERLYADPGVRLPPLALSFRDVVMARLAERDGPAHATARAWWLARLDELAPPPDLPLRVAPAQLGRPRFTRHQRRLAKMRWDAIAARAAARGLTASAVVLAAFCEVLARWSRSDRFTLNLTHFDRPAGHPDLARLVGDFTAVLLVDADCRGAVPFETRALALQRTLWAGLAQRACSGVEVMRALARQRPEAGSGTMMPVVFTSILGLEIDRLAEAAEAGGLLGEPVHLSTATPQIWLDHQVMLRKGALVYNWIVIDGLFPPGLIEAMLAAYETLLARLAGDEAAWTGPVAPLLPPEQAAVRARVNATDLPFKPAPIHAGILAAIQAQPGRPAVLHAGGALTFGALAAAADRLAAALAQRAVQPGDRVAVVLPKGPAQVAAVLAILQRGAAYVPLAHDVPPERLATIGRDAGIRVAFGGAAARTWPDGLTVLDPATLPADLPPAPEPHVAAPDELAYVIYTSGSTGTPKGVMMSHGAVANTLADINRRYRVGPADRVLAVSELSFDLSVYDLFGVLGAGGAVVLPGEAERLDPAHWLTLMRAHQVTLWNSVPALLTLLLDHAERGGEPLPGALRRVLLSGDWVPLALPGRLAQVAPQARLAVLGGATEAAIWSNQFEVTTVDPAWASIPYGTPLANQRYHVLDRRLADRPDWVAGDLHIAGAGLADGYWGDPRRTAAQFIRHPRTGERLYRTGDLARYWPDGTIEFLGREDGQVKLGGHRIELGEVEAAIGRLPGVQAAIADVIEHGSGGRALAAWVRLDEAAADAILDIRTAAPEAAAAWQAALAAAERAAAALDPRIPARAASFRAAADQLAHLAMRRTLTRLGWRDGAVLDLGQDLEPAGIAPRFRRLLGQWCQALAAAGTLRPLGPERFAVAGLVPVDDRAWAAAVARLRKVASWGEAATALVDWIVDSAERHRELLTGEAAPLEVLFPDGGLERADGLYRDNPVTAALSGTIGAALAALAEASAGDRIAMLEVGAGTGGTTAHLLPALDPARVAYTFTDLSDFFLQAAAARLDGFAGLAFARYDIDTGPEPAGLPLHQQDAVIAANVLHDAKDVVAALRHLRRLLKPGGLLVMLEATRNDALQLITAGFIEGFNDFADGRAAAGLPLLDAAAWQALAQEAGFVATAALPADEALGQHVILARAPEQATELDPERFRSALARALPAYMLPQSVQVLDRLPLTANGKLDRKRLPRPAATAGTRPGGAAPAGALEQAVAAAWGKVLATAAIGRDDHFFQRGGDSLLATRMAGELRAKLGRPVPLRLIFERPVLRAFAAALAEPGAAAGWPGRLVLAEAGPDAEATLVLLPGSDGSGQTYRALAGLLPERWTVLALQTPGLDADEAPLAELPTLAASLAERLDGAPVAGRLALGGWSFGALLAAELAQLLPVAGLVLIDAPPADILPRFDQTPLMTLQQLAADLGEAPSADIARPNGALADRQPAALWSALAAHLGIGEAGAGARLEAMLAAHLAALRTHRPRPLARPALWAESSERPRGWAADAPPWPGGLPAGSRRIVLPGDHWRLLREPAALRPLAAALIAFVRGL